MDVASTLDSKFASQNIIDVVMATLIQHSKLNVKFTTSSQRRYYDVLPTLCQVCEECQMWTIHVHMVTFLQPCLKIVKKFNNEIIFI